MQFIYCSADGRQQRQMSPSGASPCGESAAAAAHPRLLGDPDTALCVLEAWALTKDASRESGDYEGWETPACSQEKSRNSRSTAKNVLHGLLICFDDFQFYYQPFRLYHIVGCLLIIELINLMVNTICKKKMPDCNPHAIILWIFEIFLSTDCVLI